MPGLKRLNSIQDLSKQLTVRFKKRIDDLDDGSVTSSLQTETIESEEEDAEVSVKNSMEKSEEVDRSISHSTRTDDLVSVRSSDYGQHESPNLEEYSMIVEDRVKLKQTTILRFTDEI